MTAYLRVWAALRTDGTCRDCRQPFDWRVNVKTGRFLPINPHALVLSTEIDEPTQRAIEVISRDDLHFVTCRARRHERAS